MLSALLPSEDDTSLLRGALEAVEHVMRLAPDAFFPLLLRQGLIDPIFIEAWEGWVAEITLHILDRSCEVCVSR